MRFINFVPFAGQKNVKTYLHLVHQELQQLELLHNQQSGMRQGQLKLDSLLH